MGSCEEYYTRFNLGQFPRKISIEEAEKRYLYFIIYQSNNLTNEHFVFRWDRRLVIVANQDVRTKALIPEDKQCTLKLSLRYFLVLERIGRARYLGEASYGVHSLRVINSDSKVISYIRNRLTEDCLIKNQVSYIIHIVIHLVIHELCFFDMNAWGIYLVFYFLKQT